MPPSVAGKMTGFRTLELLSLHDSHSGLCFVVTCKLCGEVIRNVIDYLIAIVLSLTGNLVKWH